MIKALSLGLVIADPPFHLPDFGGGRELFRACQQLVALVEIPAARRLDRRRHQGIWGRKRRLRGGFRERSRLSRVGRRRRAGRGPA